MAKYYFNYTDNVFKSPNCPKHIKARVCVKCDNFKQVEELERNLYYINRKVGYKMYTRPKWTYHPIKNAEYMTYTECTVFHDPK